MTDIYKIDVPVKRGSNCLYSNLRDCINFVINGHLKEYQILLLSSSFKLSYRRLYGFDIAKNFIFESLEKIAFSVAEKLFIKCNVFHKNDNMDHIEILESFITKNIPILLIINSAYLNYQKPPQYFADVMAKHIILVYGFDSTKRQVYAYDTYVYHDNFNEAAYKVTLSYDEVLVSWFEMIAFTKDETMVYEKSDWNYYESIQEFILSAPNCGINAFLQSIEDLQLLRGIMSDEGKRIIKELLYTYQIKYGVMYDILEEMVKDCQWPIEEKNSYFKVNYKLKDLWRQLYSKMILSTCLFNNRSIERIVESGRCVDHEQKKILNILYSNLVMRENN